MKLVEILASEMEEWPLDAAWVGQAVDGDIHVNNSDDEFIGHTGVLLTRADDWNSAEVNQEQWQSERDRQKGGEWKRHRGGKCQVSENSVIDVKLDTGDTMKNEVAGNWEWSHQDIYPRIMQYRVISQPQAEEIDSFSESVHKPIIEALNTMAEEWHEDQIDGPIKWRDTVNELDAYIEEFTREREALIERLASEGFALIPPVVTTWSDILPFEDWEVGDLVTSKTDYNKQFTKGKQYKLTRIYEQYGTNRISIESDDKGADNGWIASNFEFHSRP